MSLVRHSSVESFFREVLVESMERRGVEAAESTEQYLVGLLGEFTRARIPDEPLSLKLVSTSDPAQRVRALKEIGDTALYVVGFFEESLSRSLVAADYYVGLGSAAYGELAARLAVHIGDADRTIHHMR